MRYLALILCLTLSASCSTSTPSLESLRCDPASTSTRDVTDPHNCTNNSGICAALGKYFRCDTGKGCCAETLFGYCGKVADCIASGSPVCNLDTGICEQCSATNTQLGDQQCAAWAATQANPSGQTLCASGKCVECKTSSDCTKSASKTICDTSSNTCKGCTKNSDCAGSQLCKLDPSMLAAGDTVANLGECVKVADVAFVDNTAAACDAAGAGGKPFCQVAQAVASGKTYINVKGNGAMMANLYQAVTVTGGKRVVIIGPGRDVALATQAVINGVMVGTTAQVTLVGISVTNNANQPAVQCSGSGTLYVQNALISDAIVAPKGGIYANTCKVVVERTKVTGASGYGLSITGGTDHRVVNNAFINNGSAAEPAGLRTSGGASGLFAYNTIAANRYGVQCDSAADITDSIVAVNAVQISATCQPARIVLDNVVLDPVYKTGGDPKLMTDQLAQCADKAMANSTVKDDYFGAARPLGVGYDIGFQEVK